MYSKIRFRNQIAQDPNLNHKKTRERKQQGAERERLGRRIDRQSLEWIRRIPWRRPDQTGIGDGGSPSRRFWTGCGGGRRGRWDETWEDVRESCGGELKSGAGVGAVADASVGGRARSTLAAASQQTGAGSGGYAAADEVVLSCFVPYRFSQVGLAQPPSRTLTGRLQPTAGRV